MSNSLQPHGLQHTRLPCPSLSLGICSHSCPLSQWSYLTIFSSATPSSFCIQSIPASVFSNELALHIKWPKYLNFSDSSYNPTPGTVAFQAPLSMGFPGKKCWNALPFPSPGHLPEPRNWTHGSVSPELAGRFFPTVPPGKSSRYYIGIYFCGHARRV